MSEATSLTPEEKREIAWFDDRDKSLHQQELAKKDAEIERLRCVSEEYYSCWLESDKQRSMMLSRLNKCNGFLEENSRLKEKLKHKQMFKIDNSGHVSIIDCERCKELKARIDNLPDKATINIMVRSHKGKYLAKAIYERINK